MRSWPAPSPTRERSASGALRLAAGAVRTTNRTVRRLGRGGGTVLGGRIGLALDGHLLGRLATGRDVALVTGTNGKTTTTRLLAVAVGEDAGPVASNTTGANMPAGHVAALAEAASETPAVLEVDESYLEAVVAATAPRAVVLLNLSRDQLDRVSEVRMLADRWRRALDRGAPDPPVVVANADDPMVVWGAGTAADVRWVGAGQVWRADAGGCPACGGRVVFGTGGGWACDRCDFARPDRVVWLEDHDVVAADGQRWPLDLALPGAFNRANATMAAVAAAALSGLPVGLGVPIALARLAGVDDVVGRFATVVRRGRSLRLLLAKNPAGWTALFDLLDEEGATGEAGAAGGPRGPMVLSVNARTADGHDPSWLWDVPYERLADRSVVVATGDRRRDLAVRLQYAGVTHRVVDDPLVAVDAALAGADHDGRCELVANYTAFADLRRALA